MKKFSVGQKSPKDYIVDRLKKGIEITEEILNLLSIEPNLAIVDIQQRLGMKRSTLKHWLVKLEKKGLIISKRLNSNYRGRPTVYRVNKRRINEREILSAKKFKSFEEYMIKSMLAQKILDEIDKDQSSEKQHKELIKLFKEFKEDSSWAAKMNFLLRSEYIKIDYNLSLTPKGKASKRKREKYKAKKKASS
jgi:predicted ArsR family transcriptional regulator